MNNITKDMTKVEQVRAIYKYVNASSTVKFTDESNIPNIDRSKIKDPSNQLDEFTLVIDKKNDFDIYSDAAGIAESDAGKHRSYRVNVRRMCLITTLAAKDYYYKNKDKFDFFNYKILDWDKEVENLHRLNIVWEKQLWITVQCFIT